MQKLALYVATTAVLLSACATPSTNSPEPVKLTYPETRTVEQVDTFFGVAVPDPYRWIETAEPEERSNWIDAQNAVTESYLNQAPYRAAIKARLEELWNYPKYGAPSKRGDHYFFTKNDGLQAQGVLYKQKGLDADPEVFIDPNTLSEDGTTSLSAFSVSKDGRYAAYGTAQAGSDWNEFHVREIATGKDMSDHLKWIKFSGAAWKGDGFYYGRYPQPKEGEEMIQDNQGKQIFFHRLGEPQAQDQLVFELPDQPKTGIYAATTEDERYLLLYLSEGATSNNALYVRSLEREDAPILKLVDHHRYSYDVIDNLGDTLLISTNDGAPRRRVIAVDLNHPEPANWQTLIPEAEEVLNGVSIAGDKLYATYLKDAQSRVHVFGLDGSPKGELDLPGIGTTGGVNGRKGQRDAFFGFTSYLYPSTIFRLDTETDEVTPFRQSEVKFDPANYETKQVFYPSKDGTKIPMFITHKKGLKLDGNNPTLLYGYGGFNVNILPSFSTSNIVLLENGGVYAVAVLRGGGEYGEDWHQSGMLLNKQNVFDDFISAGEFLIKEGYTQSERLAIMGRSNGGLLVGAAMTQRPELFGVAFPGVGVMDMLRYHKFTIGHAWVVEYGDPGDSAHFQNLHKFSPLHNLEEGTVYPSTLVTTGDHDDRVVPEHSFKFAARLQAAHAGENPVLLRVEKDAGHGAGKPTAKIIEEQADIWTFMFLEMGVNPINDAKN